METEKKEEAAKTKEEKKSMEDSRIKETGQVTLNKNKEKVNIHLLTIIGEIEGHDILPSSSKATKYEHILPQLASLEDSTEIDGVLVLINTVGGDVSCGLALAEMIASLSKPTVSLVIGDSHSIGVPLAVSTDYSFIVPTGTMLIHPVRMNGMIIGAPQTYHYFQRIQERITSFIAAHSHIAQGEIEKMMMNTQDLSKDLGTLLVGKDVVEKGLLDEVGGIKRALEKLHEMIKTFHPERKEESNI
ncbi:Clp protease [bacterium 1XD42-8]|jgi:ATP-dependent protease ClpP protease subunit|nr:Clp protease [Lachnospiraceae bacterium]RKJ48746.1 Clp protease [bacterium 1XD42-8]